MAGLLLLLLLLPVLVLTVALLAVAGLADSVPPLLFITRPSLVEGRRLLVLLLPLRLLMFRRRAMRRTFVL